MSDFFLLAGAFGGSKHLPYLRGDFVLLKKLEGCGVFAPEGEEFDFVFFVGEDLFFESSDVFFSPIVGATGEAKFLEHDRTLLGGSLGGVEWDDAPGDEFALLEIFRRFLCDEGGTSEEEEKAKDHEIQNGQPRKDARCWERRQVACLAFWKDD